MLIQLRASDPMVWSTAAKHPQHHFKWVKRKLPGKTATRGKKSHSFKDKISEPMALL